MSNYLKKFYYIIINHYRNRRPPVISAIVCSIVILVGLVFIVATVFLFVLFSMMEKADKVIPVLKVILTVEGYIVALTMSSFMIIGADWVIRLFLCALLLVKENIFKGKNLLLKEGERIDKLKEINRVFPQSDGLKVFLLLYNGVLMLFSISCTAILLYLFFLRGVVNFFFFKIFFVFAVSCLLFYCVLYIVFRFVWSRLNDNDKEFCSENLYHSRGWNWDILSSKWSCVRRSRNESIIFWLSLTRDIVFVLGMIVAIMLILYRILIDGRPISIEFEW